jgi:hypothetical protein
MSRSFHRAAVFALAALSGGVLIGTTFGAYILFPLFFERQVVTGHSAGIGVLCTALVLVVVGAAGRSLVLAMEWIDGDVPPWVTDEPQRRKRIAAAGALAWLLIAPSWLVILFDFFPLLTVGAIAICSFHVGILLVTLRKLSR